MPTYDYQQLWGAADTTAGQLIDAGTYDAVVESSEWGITKGGDKGAWTVRFRITTGPHAGVPLTTTMTVSPVTNDGQQNNAGLGILFNQLAALGVPVPPNQPFWALGWTEVNVAQVMVGKPASIRVIKDDEYGNNKIKRINAPRPGAPTDWPRGGQQTQALGPIAAMPGQFAQNGMAMQQAAGYGPPQGQDPYAQQQQPQPPQGPYGQPNAPWNPMAQPQQQPQQGPAQPFPGQPGVNPGQPGAGQFTQQGQAQQPWMQQPPTGGAQQYGAPPAQEMTPQQGYGTPPGPQPGQAAPWNQAPQQGQYQQPQPPQGPQGFQQPQQPQQPQQNGQQPQVPPQGGPAMPPWAQ